MLKDKKFIINPHGSYLNVDENGHVIPIKNIEIQEKWAPISEAVIKFYKSKFEDNLHSVYVRGSVAKGEAIDYLSDFDSFCILNNIPKDLTEPFSEEFQNDIKKDFPFCDGVEISYINKDQIYESHCARKRGLFEELIKTQSICLYGDDLSSQIKDFKLSEMIAHSYFIAADLKTMKEDYDATDVNDSRELQSICTWISKRIVRCGFDLVMQDCGKWTRDLYLCYEQFANDYPHKKDLMYQFLDLSLNPIDSSTHVQKLMDDFSPWLLDEIENKLKINLSLGQ